MTLVLAYDGLRDPRDLAEALHLAAGLGAEVQLIGRSLEAGHWKVRRKLRSWRPDLSEAPEQVAVARFPGFREWAAGARSRGLLIAGTVLSGGVIPWTSPEGAAMRDAAVLFGEETHGLGAEARRLCDVLWTIPLGPGGRFYTVGQATGLVLGARLALGP
ncbi:MAG: hypothetical protein HY721_03145 [Planctomycetes bacterium]|nr:hypothetical protein [Planctomycetota bacterium]